jgi:transcriptional regulator with XRE-family HTH domain
MLDEAGEAPRHWQRDQRPYLSKGTHVPEVNRLAEWCATRGWTMTDAAGLTGYSVSYMSLLARGKRPLSPDAKVKIARRLGARVAELFPVSPADMPEAAGDEEATT